MPPDDERNILADLVWNGSKFVRGAAARLNSDGTIALDASANVQTGMRLPRHALLPGFVNAHSHAFQRGLRSQSQRFDTGSGNFWSWRETMYRLVATLDVDSFYETSKSCFEEMLLAGFTSVGEFHYLHHAGASCDDWAFDDAIIAAARDAGIRLVLIPTYYATGNIGSPLEGAQRRFSNVSREQFVKQFDRLRAKIDPKTQSPAIACHSIRAVTLDDLCYFRDFSLASALPFHIHVEEARKEIDDCRNAYGSGPLAVLLDRLKVDATMTAIHCTHSTETDLSEYVGRGGKICLCPITEGNLSDGFPNVPAIRARGGKLCIGTDSNIRISPGEELRWMEFGQRLRHERRGIVVDQSGGCASALMEIGTRNGAESLGINAGAISTGKLADLIAVDLDHPSMRGATDDAILDSLIFGNGNGAIDHVWVGGKRINPKRSGRDVSPSPDARARG